MENHNDFQELFQAMAYSYWEEANKLFGENMNEWQYDGIIYGEFGPMIRYFHNEKKVKIMVLTSVNTDFYRGLFQLSHEIVHLISPTGLERTTNLEEGCVVWFSFLQINKFGGGSDYLNSCKIENTNYGKTFALVSKLLSTQPEAIKLYREHQPLIGKIGLLEFEKVGTFGLTEEEIIFLSQTFIGR